MSEMDLIAPPQDIAVAFALEPAYNALCSLCLIGSDLSGLGEWVEHTAASLSPEQRQANEMSCGIALSFLRGRTEASFPAFLDGLADQDPVALRDREVDAILAKTAKTLGVEREALPDRKTLIADRAAYVSLIQRGMEAMEEACDEACLNDQHAQLQDPIALLEQSVSHLRAMWDGYLAEEWERSLPALEASVAAYASINYAGKSGAEIISLVADRELPARLEELAGEAKEIIFIPSPHIGPYLAVMDDSPPRARIVFGARIPEGATVVSPALNRSELVTRLGALADDTRLRILELVSHRGELRAPEIMAELDLSQSATSRHLRQLSATGFLTTRRCEGAKCYCLSDRRIDDTFAALQRFLQ